MLMKELKREREVRLLASALLALLLSAAFLPRAEAQTRADLPPFIFDSDYYSSRVNEKKAIHDGNEVAITFFNYGLLGGTGEVRGNWPKGSEDFYVGDVLPVVAAEVPIDLDGDGTPDTTVVHAVTTRGPRGNQNSPPGNQSIFWGFEAKPGFASDVRSDGEPNGKPALSTDAETWPDFWPDQPTWMDPATGRAPWNGYFGRGIKNADLESYFWMDDQNDGELQFRYPNFVADTTRPERKGMGLEVKARGMQWSQFLAQDALYFLYEVTNSSTTTYPRVAVGLTVGTLAGGDGDSQDDMAFFDQANRIVYSWDYDNRGNRQQPVGYVGYAFMESPGDDFNGLDDDGDADPFTDLGLNVDKLPFVNPAVAGEGNVFTAADFMPRVLQAGDPLILIDAKTGERSITYMGDGPTTVVSQGITYNLTPGQAIEEATKIIRGQRDEVTVTARNLIDEDLDGVLDEDENLHFNRRQETVEGGVRQIVTVPAVRYVNYVGLANDIRNRTATHEDSVRHGFLNPMIDEAREDGIDNDGDWNPLTDDTGADGAAGTGDRGEGDGKPTPGEPNFDALDVDESDQVGLTSFYYFTPPGALQMNNDNRIWEAMNPGFFTTNAELEAQQAGKGIDGDFIFSSGYFRLEPGQTLRFSMAMVFGQDLVDITNNSKTVQEIYDRNYNFARPPDRPTLYAAEGDGRVTLYWDSIAEQSVDPVLGMDFEGYRLYRSTDPYFKDPAVVTDVFGNRALLAPMIQFDLKNNLSGYWMPSADNNLYERVRGVPFYLGSDTGIRHSYVDTTVQNGRTYYYALNAYDHGSSEFYPAENDRAISVSEDNVVVTGTNVVEVRPNAPAAGYFAGTVSTDVAHASGAATGDVLVEVLNPMMLRENTEYRVIFSGAGVSADSFRVESRDGTVVSKVPIGAYESAIFDGMRVIFRNDGTRLNMDETKWENPDGKVPLFVARNNVSQWRYEGVVAPYDYEIRFKDTVVDTSIGGFRLGTNNRGPVAVATPTYFEVYNTTLGRPSDFVFLEPAAATANGRFDDNEFIFIYETFNGTRTSTYGVRADVDFTQPFEGSFPSPGDVFKIATYKPFSPNDQYTFTTASAGVDEELAANSLDKIKVVPNPYVAGAAWEKSLPVGATGRGERRVDFIHVPANASIRIYNVRGELVRELFHDGAIDDGTVSWNLRTREDLDLAFGVYFYHVDVPGVGETTGKIAVIK